MPRPEGILIKEKSKSKGYNCQNETFRKYGKDINIHDFIQAGKEGTIAKEIIEKAGGISVIKNQMKEVDASETVIDMNLDPFTANQILKCGKIAKEKIEKELKIQEELKKIEEETKTIKKGEGNE